MESALYAISRERGLLCDPAESVDLVALCGVLVVGSALLLPALAQARGQARRSACANNLKQMGLALHNYHDVFVVFPMGRVWQPDPKRNPLDCGAATMLLPYVEQAGVYNAYNFSLAWHGLQNGTARNAKLEVFLCPDDQKQTATAKVDPTGQPLNYAFNLGAEAWLTQPAADKPRLPDGLFFDNSRVSIREIIDGTSLTVMVSEQLIDQPRRSGAPNSSGDCSGAAVSGNRFADRTGARWVTGHPSSGYYNARRTPNHREADCFDLLSPGGIGTLNKVARSKHDGGVHVLMADGSARFAPDSIDATIWRNLHTRAGAEPLEIDDVLRAPIPVPDERPGRGREDDAPRPLVELTLRYKTGPTKVEDAEGRWQYSGGDLIAENILVGHFSSAVRVSSAVNSINAGAVRMTLLIKGTDPPENIVLEGSHSFSSGNQTGGVAAASQQFRQFVGEPYRVTDGKLTIGGAPEDKPPRPARP